MNYYERYCGDYARDTAHLHLAEHGAYTVLLDTQYATERGLPADYAALYRICRAMSKAEQTVVRSVADQFFPVDEDGLRWNRRARKDIAKAQPRIVSARANGAHGGRPKKTHEKPSGFPDENPMGFQNETQTKPSENPRETQPGEAFPHAPHTNHQKAEKRESRARRAPAPAKTPLPPDFAISDRVRQWAARKGVEHLEERFEHFVGKVRMNGYTYLDWDDALMTAIRDDWAKLNGKPPTNGAASRLSPAGQKTAENMQRWLDKGEAKDATQR